MGYKSKFIICLIFLLIFRKIYSSPNIDKEMILQIREQINNFLHYYDDYQALTDMTLLSIFIPKI